MTHMIPADQVPEGTVTSVDRYAVGNNGAYFAVGRRCRHLRADLAEGTIDPDGCLVCPWHGAAYDVTQRRDGARPARHLRQGPGAERRLRRADPGLAVEARPGRARGFEPVHRLVRRLGGGQAGQRKVEPGEGFEVRREHVPRGRIRLGDRRTGEQLPRLTQVAIELGLRCSVLAMRVGLSAGRHRTPGPGAAVARLPPRDDATGRSGGRTGSPAAAASPRDRAESFGYSLWSADASSMPSSGESRVLRSVTIRFTPSQRSLAKLLEDGVKTTGTKRTLWMPRPFK